MALIDIMIVDDHQLFREGIVSLLADDEDIEVIGVASSAEEMLSNLKSTHPHIVLIDISMGEMDGLEAIRKAKVSYPKIKFIVITMHAEGQYVVKAARHGAHGFLLKNTDGKALSDAIHTVFEDKKYFSEEVSLLMVDNMALEGESDKKLSKREMEVLKLVSNGKTTKEIAEELFVSTRTVETHRVNMMKKLKVQNTAELIKKAAHLKMV